MALNKQSISINFASGLDTKSDPKQVQVGKFLELTNSVFDKAGLLTKRNGFKTITTLPNADQTNLTTLNGNLIATGTNLYTYSADTNQWISKGLIQPVDLKVQSMIRSSANQSNQDMALADTGLACLVFLEGTTSYYQVLDSTTGQQIVGKTALPTGSVLPRVFVLGRFFIVTYLISISTVIHLQYVAIPFSNPSAPRSAADISTVVKSISAGYDAIVYSNNLYISFAATSTSILTTYMSSSLVVQAPAVISSRTATNVAVTVDTSNSTVYTSFYDSVSQNMYIASYSTLLVPILANTLVASALNLANITSIATNGVVTLFYEVNNAYSFTPNTKTNYISKVTISSSGTIGTPAVVLRSVGLSSKPFINDNVIYVMCTYGEDSQPTYFLIDSSGNVYSKLAYSNGGGYSTSQILPSVSFKDSNWYFPYLIKDFLTTVNKGTNIASGTPVNAIYTQTGIDLAIFTINQNKQYVSEIANALHLTGGMLWEFDGVKPVEHGFHLYPAMNTVTTATGSGSIAAGTYFYVFTYEWTDNQGNIHRSAPSIPVKIVTTTPNSTNTLNIPTLRITYKDLNNPVRIVGYRWSLAQQTYYQFTSVTSPTLNSTTVDSVTFTDTLADSSILGNPILYTTGGVIENIGAPACSTSALFKSRLFLVDAENRNLIWYSKQVIQNTPVEMSDLLTIYVAPTSGAQGSTGDITALSAMDDKLIIFKKDAIYYLTGTGPDNTGANNDFNDPIFITAAVGCDNPKSIVLTPNGLMFQSDKGIWLLGRDLSTNYIGAAVERYNSYIVKDAQVIPGTNQVRFIIGSNITLMFDYYYQQWGSFSNIDAISATLYKGADTYLNSLGAIFQETPNYYLDGSEPVLISFTTSWVSLAGIQGLERFYFMYLLGTYYSPFKLNVQIAYDYNESYSQNVVVQPDNFNLPWGDEALWGSGAGWGGNTNVLEARIFPSQQKCETFKMTVIEQFDPSFGVSPGQGLSISGLNVIVGAKRSFRTNKAGQSFG